MSRPQNSFELFLNPKNSPLGPQKVKNDHNFKPKSRVKINETLENNRCLTTWVQHKKVFEPYPIPKNSPLGPQKVKNDPKIKSKSNVRIERKKNKENENCSSTWVDPKQF